MPVSGFLGKFVGAAADLRRADQLIASGDAAGGFARLAKAAAAGHVEAQYRVGRAYLEATGVPPSVVEAASWFERAGSAGHVESQARLAGMLMQGQVGGGRSSALFQPAKGAGPDFAAAVTWARKAAAGGSADGKAVLATIFSSGPEEMRDLVAAEALYREAAEGGSAQGQLGLALMLARGEPKPELQQEAAALMAKASGDRATDGGLPAWRDVRVRHRGRARPGARGSVVQARCGEWHPARAGPLGSGAVWRAKASNKIG